MLITLPEKKLRLSEILVVDTHKHRLFMGVYSGLITPLSFKAQKTGLVFKGIDNLLIYIPEYLDTPEKQLLATHVTPGLGKLAGDNPNMTPKILELLLHISLY